MFWRSENEVIEEFIRLFRRVIKYKSSWVNKDFRIVDISEDTPKVYEKFFEENEEYPVITVSGNGYTRTNQSFNSHLGVFQSRIIDMGSRGLGLALVDNTHGLSFAIPTSIDNDDTLHGLEFYAVSSELELNLETLDVQLRQDSYTGSIVSSASIPYIITPVYNKYFTEFYPLTVLSASSYWLTFSAQASNSFLVGIDNTAVNVFNYISGSVTQASGSLHGRLYTPPMMRLGGSIEGTITIKCSDKNSTRQPREILSIIANYINLLTQAQLTRESGTDNTTLAMGEDNPVDEWLRKDIRIKNIRQGASQERRRGENDIIHSYDLAVDYYTEWNEDYQKDLLSEIVIELDDNAIDLYSEEDIDLDI